MTPRLSHTTHTDNLSRTCTAFFTHWGILSSSHNTHVVSHTRDTHWLPNRTHHTPALLHTDTPSLSHETHSDSLNRTRTVLLDHLLKKTTILLTQHTLCLSYKTHTDSEHRTHNTPSLLYNMHCWLRLQTEFSSILKIYLQHEPFTLVEN